MLDTLTPREKEVLKEIATGDCNELISRRLGITSGVVKLHVKSIFEKIGVDNRTKAAVMYVRHELGFDNNNQRVENDGFRINTSLR